MAQELVTLEDWLNLLGQVEIRENVWLTTKLIRFCRALNPRHHVLKIGKTFCVTKPDELPEGKRGSAVVSPQEGVKKVLASLISSLLSQISTPCVLVNPQTKEFVVFVPSEKLSGDLVAKLEKQAIQVCNP